MWRVIILLTAVSSFSVAGANGGLFSRMGPREVERLLKSVDPPTCRCNTADECQIAVPDVSMIGVKCHGPTIFCCRARKMMKPFLTPADWAELHATVKRLKVEQQLMSLVANKSPEDVKNFLARDQTRLPLPPSSPTPSFTTALEMSTISSTSPASITTQYAGCTCVEVSQCPTEQMDFSFGKSCKFGQVRCCIPEETTPSSLIQESQSTQIDTHAEPAMTTDAPSTKITEAPSTSPTTEATPPATAEPTSDVSLTSKQRIVPSVGIDQKPLPSSGRHIPKPTFVRYSLPQILSGKPARYYYNRVKMPSSRPRYQPPPTQNSLERNDPKEGNIESDTKQPPLRKPIPAPTQYLTSPNPTPHPVLGVPKTSLEGLAIPVEVKTNPHPHVQHRKIVVNENEDIHDKNSSKLQQEEVYHKYLSQLQQQRHLEQVRLQQQQSGFMNQLQGVFSSVTNGFRKMFG